jgi:hypothetical protein
MERPKLKLSSKITAILGKHITNITKRLAIDLICPISRELFEDPVICAGDGQTYERKEIEEWLKNKNTSPFDTSKPLTSKTLIPNIAVRKLADAVRVEKLETTRTDEVPELKVQDGKNNALLGEYHALVELYENRAEQLDEYHDTIVALSAKRFCDDTDNLNALEQMYINGQYVYKWAFCNQCGHALPEDTPDMYQVEMSGVPEFAEDSFTDWYYLGTCEECCRRNDRRIALATLRD